MHRVISPCTANNRAELPQCSFDGSSRTFKLMQYRCRKPPANQKIYLKKTDFCLKNRRGCHKMTRFRTLPTNHEPKLHQCLASCKMCKLLNYRARISHLGSVPDSEHRGEGSFNKLLNKQWSKQCFLFARTRQYDAIEASLRFADIGNAESLNQDPKMKSDWIKKTFQDVSKWLCTCDCCLKMISKIFARASCLISLSDENGSATYRDSCYDNSLWSSK